MFLPLTRKKNIAVVNSRVSGFKFGAMEFDIPIHELYPTPLPKPPDSPEPWQLPFGAIFGIVVGVVALLAALSFLYVLIAREKRGEPIFMKIPPEPTDLTSKPGAGQIGIVTVTSAQQSVEHA